RLADDAARDLALATLLHLSLDAIGHRLDRVGGHRPLLAGADQAVDDLLAVERLAPPRPPSRQPGGGGRPPPGRGPPPPPPPPPAGPPAPDGVASLPQPRVDDATVRGPAERAPHRGPAPLAALLREPVAVDREALAEPAHLVAEAREGTVVAEVLQRTVDQVGDLLHLRLPHAARGHRGRADA